MQLEIIATLVRSEHDRIRGLVVKLLQVTGRCGEQLEIGTTTFLSITKLNLW